MGEGTRHKKDGGGRGAVAVQVGEASIGASGDGNESGGRVARVREGMVSMQEGGERRLSTRLWCKWGVCE